MNVSKTTAMVEPAAKMVDAGAESVRKMVSGRQGGAADEPVPSRTR